MLWSIIMNDNIKDNENNVLQNEFSSKENLRNSISRNSISRYKMREQAFVLCFETLFSDTDIDEIADNTLDSREIELSDYALNTAKGISKNSQKIDDLISSHLKKGWKINRISKVSLAVLRLAIYEMLFVDEIPVSVSINEAVELTKKYSTEDDCAFVNGVLGAVSKEI